ncbi:MAG: hypothetical protein AB7D96_05405 [Arcobacteraceae bacterium]
MEEIIFEKRIDIFEELLPYKDFFDCALHFVHRTYINEKTLFFIDYAPNENPKRKTARIKITYNLTLYTQMYEELKKLTNKSDRVLINNILSSLVGIPQFKPITEKKKIPNG